ncbi:unnamed protein product [Closterium sp. Naga37s-1]|nr:unnamed protein product [Closterium sp. Naga37s-1]
MVRTHAACSALCVRAPHLHAYAPHLHAYAPHLHAYAPHLHAYAPHLHAYAPHLHAYAPHLHAYAPHLHAYAPHLHAYAPHLHAYAPRLFFTIPQIIFLATFLLLLSFWIDLCHQASDSTDKDEEEEFRGTYEVAFSLAVSMLPPPLYLAACHRIDLCHQASDTTDEEEEEDDEEEERDVEAAGSSRVVSNGAYAFSASSTSGTPPSSHSAHSLATAARHAQAQGGRGISVGKGGEGHGASLPSHATHNHGASLQQPLLDAAAGVMGGVGRQGAGGGGGGGGGGGRGGLGGGGGGGGRGGVGSSAASDGARTPRFRWQKLRVKGRQRIVVAVVSFISLLTAVFAFLIWYGFGDNPIDPTLMAQMHADFFAVATLLSGGGLAFYGLLLFSKMSVLRAGPSAADLSKIAWLAGMCLLCFSLRAFIVLAKYIPPIMSLSFRDKHGNLLPFWFLVYHCIGEAVSSAMVLFILNGLPPKSRLPSSSIFSSLTPGRLASPLDPAAAAAAFLLPSAPAAAADTAACSGSGGGGGGGGGVGGGSGNSGGRVAGVAGSRPGGHVGSSNSSTTIARHPAPQLAPLLPQWVVPPEGEPYSVLPPAAAAAASSFAALAAAAAVAAAAEAAAAAAEAEEQGRRKGSGKGRGRGKGGAGRAGGGGAERGGKGGGRGRARGEVGTEGNGRGLENADTGVTLAGASGVGGGAVGGRGEGSQVGEGRGQGRGEGRGAGGTGDGTEGAARDKSSKTKKPSRLLVILTQLLANHATPNCSCRNLPIFTLFTLLSSTLPVPQPPIPTLCYFSLTHPPYSLLFPPSSCYAP